MTTDLKAKKNEQITDLHSESFLRLFVTQEDFEFYKDHEGGEGQEITSLNDFTMLVLKRSFNDGKTPFDAFAENLLFTKLSLIQQLHDEYYEYCNENPEYEISFSLDGKLHFLMEHVFHIDFSTNQLYLEFEDVDHNHGKIPILHFKKVLNADQVLYKYEFFLKASDKQFIDEIYNGVDQFLLTNNFYS